MDPVVWIFLLSPENTTSHSFHSTLSSISLNHTMAEGILADGGALQSDPLKTEFLELIHEMVQCAVQESTHCCGRWKRTMSDDRVIVVQKMPAIIAVA